GALAQVIEVAPNLTAPVQPLGVASPTHPGEPLAACFLGRVSAMKNLRFAIEAVSRVSRPVRFDIFGPIEDRASWEECEKLIARAPTHCTIRWRGEVEPDRVR
ncbi:MAG: hypothetical protein ACKO2K_17105, partial [Alphaproteobacteria bacterium]